jgi:hypothetical protein
MVLTDIAEALSERFILGAGFSLTPFDSFLAT